MFDRPNTQEPLAIALEYIGQALPGFAYEVTDHYVTKKNGVTHVYGRQLVNGRQIANAYFNINVDRQGRVINMAESFFKGEALAATEPRIDPLAALLSFAKGLNIPVSKKIQLVKFFGGSSLFHFFSLTFSFFIH